MMNWIRFNWCKSMHNEAMWPMHGKYICPRCLLEYPVPWEAPLIAPEYAGATLRSIPKAVPYAAEQRVA